MFNVFKYGEIVVPYTHFKKNYKIETADPAFQLMRFPLDGELDIYFI